jgi:peptidoglycan-associated lipoprotein
MRFTLMVCLAAAALLAGCSSSPTQTQPPASVEERTPGGGTPGAKPVGTAPVTPVDVTRGPGGSTLGPLKDPASPLSKRSVYFDFDKFDVKDEYRPLVDLHAHYLRDNGAARMLVQGNTDERGSREYNVALGQRRADSVKKMLVLLGAREAQVESVSLGEEKPQDAGRTEAAWAKNRRADMLYGGEY